MAVRADLPPVPEAGSPTPSKPSFRPDVDGLRAIAILVVVAFHARVPGFDGGFVGVDVFFVISGYLITRNLLHERASEGRVSLARFWARRIRRLVPAMGLVVVATLVGALVVLPAIEVGEVVREGRAATLYVSNILFAVDLGDYFDGEVASSPFLHTWSLGVEEQFYVVWPLLVGLVAYLAHRAGAALRSTLGVAFAVVGAVSFAISLSLTADGTPWAFYGLQSRTWEFAVAGLLAVVGPSLASRRWPRTAGAVAGLAAIGLATVVLDESVAYPGLWALLPVLGTAAVILAGEAEEGADLPVASALALPSAQWLGRVSYSWYLWHWPFIVLAAEAFNPGRRVAVLAAGASLVVAAALYRWFENPVRFAPVFARSLGRTYAMGAGVTLLALLAGLGVAALAQAQKTDLDVVLDRAAADARVNVCPTEATSPSGIEYCEGGDPAGATTVVLVGDSHARHWTGAFDAAARNEGLRLVHRWRGACPMLSVTIFRPNQGREVTRTCEAYKQDTWQLIDELQPDAVVISNASMYQSHTEGPEGGLVEPDAASQLWEEALRDDIEALRAEGIAVGLVQDNPGMPFDVIECVARERDTDACSADRAQVQRPARFMRRAVVAAAEGLDVPTFAVTDEICGEERCVVAIGEDLVFADNAHLTTAFTITQVPRLRTFLQAVLDSG